MLRGRIRVWMLMLLCLGSLAPISARAQLLKEELPDNARKIDVENKVGDFVPLDCLFTDERGNKIALGKFFNRGKPIVLTLNYSDCPGLCIAQLDNLVGTLRAMNAKGLGEDYEIVTVSIDPREDYIKAAKTKSKYIGLLRDSDADKAWHFLTGRQQDIQRLAQSVGFRYSYDRANQRYNHPAATYFVSPKGRICRYLLSLGVEPQQFQLAVAEANEGKLTLSVADAIIQFCYLYDPDANRYSADARRILAFAAGAFALLLLGTTAPFWFSKRRQADPADDPEAAYGGDDGRVNEPHHDGVSRTPTTGSAEFADRQYGKPAAAKEPSELKHAVSTGSNSYNSFEDSGTDRPRHKN